MPKQLLAIATCRVSSIEQLESNSLNRQYTNVKKAAEYLKVIIPSDGLWSGSMSSKSGTNYSRKDLKQMLEYCKKNPNVKYLIVDEIDRFMRSIDEMFYFEVLFRETTAVKVWYAEDPELNSDDPITKLRRAMKAFEAEGSNDERQRKSVNGQTAALKDGRWPFVPKPGYMKGRECGIPEIHPVRGKALRIVLLSLVSHTTTPSQALADLNNSEFMAGGHSLYKMDKFRKIVTDVFYAGIVEMDKQVKVRNENGLHEPLITKEQHYELMRIMDKKVKNQNGPRQNGNPKYPANNIVSCDLCLDKRNGRVVGFDHTNGKSEKVYEKYRCRSCGRYITRQEMHTELKKQFTKYRFTKVSINNLLEALEIIWKQKEKDNEQEINRLDYKIKTINVAIEQQVEAVTDPSNTSIKNEILKALSRKKIEVEELENHLNIIKSESNENNAKFVAFALDFVSNLENVFFDLSNENRLRCKQVLFPAGFYLDANKKVYTPEVSPLISLVSKKKDAEASDNSHMVPGFSHIPNGILTGNH